MAAPSCFWCFWLPFCPFRRRLLFCFRALGTWKVLTTMENRLLRASWDVMGFFVQGNTDKTSAPANMTTACRGRIVRIWTFLYHCWHFSHWCTKKDCETLKHRSVSSPSVRETLSASPSWRLWMLTVFTEEEAGFSVCQDNAVLRVGVYFLCWLSADHTVQNLTSHVHFRLSYSSPDIKHTHTHTHTHTQFRLNLITKMSLQANQGRDPTDLPRYVTWLINVIVKDGGDKFICSVWVFLLYVLCLWDSAAAQLAFSPLSSLQKHLTSCHLQGSAPSLKSIGSFLKKKKKYLGIFQCRVS